MKLKLNKKKLINLSKDANALPFKMTKQVAGGGTNINTAACGDMTYADGGCPSIMDRISGCVCTRGVECVA
jgi:hypothetical protein